MANELFDDEPNTAVAKPARAAGKNGKKAETVATVAAPAPVAAGPVAAIAIPAGGTVVTMAAPFEMEAPFEDEPEEGLNGLSAASSTEPGGATPLMAAPTSPANNAAPPLPERIIEARTGESVSNIFAGEGLKFGRYFTKEGVDVWDTTEWDYRSAAIKDEKGGVVFEQKDCEIPKSWSMLATNVVVSKYFRGKVGTPGREKSVKQLISRVADTIYEWGKKGGYFATETDANTFHDELKYLLLHQHMAFNSPVWFNLGVPGERSQVSACQPYDALVSTPQGLIPIGRLVEENAVGTTVYDAHGATRIVATKANGRKDVLRLHTKDGHTLDVTADHLVWKMDDDAPDICLERGDFVQAGTLEIGDRLTYHDSIPDDGAAIFGVKLGGNDFFRASESQEIIRIENLGAVEVYDIQTESGEYLSGNVRVHNCFINSVDDTMESILTLAKTEGMLFKWGSGTGTNFSVIRSSQEGLKGGGTASGPVSFMRGFDSFAGAIKSGGKTRRAAKMVILNADHPDIEEFIECKADAEKKAHALIEAGYSGAFNVANGAYDSVYFQNANHSVRATDEFMRAVEQDRDWTTYEVTTGEPSGTFKARDLMAKIAAAAWVCGDPGMQFDTTANRWHTCPNSGRINASNPCCFTGDTLVAVADGRNAVPFRDLVGKVVPVYSWNHETGKTVIAEMYNVSVKRKGAKVFRVTLDDGSTFRATDDHLIMLRDGSYRQVKDLKRGDSLNPFHSNVRQPQDTRSKRQYVHTGGAWKAQYRWIWEAANGPQPGGYHIHHRDFDSLNDALVNLGLMPEAEHMALHREMMLGENNPARRLMSDAWRANISRAVSGENNPNYGNSHGDETRAKMREASAGRWGDPEQREHASDAAKNRVAKARAEGKRWGRTPGERFERACPCCRQNFITAREEQIFCSSECRYSRLGLDMIGAKGGATRQGRPLSETHRESLRASPIAAAKPEDKRRAAEESLRARCLKAARLLTDAGHDISLDDWNGLRDTARQLGAAHVPQTESLARFFVSDAELREATALYNHKVVSVKFDGEEDVYDGTVEGHHNFAIITSATAGVGGEKAPDYSGVFVHNSEYFFLDDSACNLASLNLMKFRSPNYDFDVEAFQSAVRVTITAMEIMVGNAAYPTDKITINSFDYRPLGLGYANLGALLMARGLAYDSDEGRAYSAAITAILSGTAYHQSAKAAGRVGPFAGFEKNRQPMLRVMQMHRDHVDTIHAAETVPAGMVKAAKECWDEAIVLGTENGYRNSQISVLAPTGCLVAGSMVLTDRGLMRLDRLGDINGEQWQDANFNVLTDEGPRPATKFYVNGAELTRRIVTKAGYAIQGTLKHRIKVVDAATGKMEWKRFSDIQPGDAVALSMGQLVGEPRIVNLPPLGEEYWTGDYTTKAPRTMTPELAELIGYFMGDGSLHSKGPRFCVANADTDVAARVKTLVKELFNLDARITPQEGYQEVSVHSVPLTLWWEACGFAKRRPNADHSGKGYVPHIPDAVLATNDPATYGAFLRGLYEADGTVTGGVPCWTTVQRSFSEEVKTLLLALGLPTVTRTTRTGWGDSAAYVLRLRNSSYADYYKEVVGFMGERKAALVTRAKGEQTARHDYLYLAPEVLDELVPKAHPLYSAISQAQKRHDGAITRRAAIALYAETGDARIAHALGFFYDTVAANEDGGEQLTYDLSVPSNVTYIAQGFISHNTIGFLMDCDTTGVEPDIAIVKYKSLVGGGMFKIVNQTVPEALERLGYSASERKAILDYVDANDTIEGAPGLSDAHLSVFDCAFRARNGVRSIHYMGHIKMMSAVQPFLSGAISKTVNMPHEATPEEIAAAYSQAWALGVKALAIYRDGSKKTQPLSTGKADNNLTEKPAAPKEPVTISKEMPVLVAEAPAPVEMRPLRRKLPDERQSLTHKFSVGGHEGYLTVGMYPEGKPGEIFITMSKEGSVVSGLMDAFATSISLALQYGVPLKTLVDKFMHTRFEPSGFTGNPDIPMAKSIMDYLFRYMALKFLQKDERGNVGLLADQTDEYGDPTDMGNAPLLTVAASSRPEPGTPGQPGQAGPAGVPAASDESRTLAAERQVFVTQSDAPPCPDCGSITTRNGACYRCANCGASLGCS